MAGSNLYTDVNGNRVIGRFIYKTARNQKYMAQMRYPAGYQKSKTFDTLEEAVDFIEGNWTVYESGSYVVDGVVIRLRYPGEPRVFNL
jgi:hypothetical protein